MFTLLPPAAAPAFPPLAAVLACGLHAAAGYRFSLPVAASGVYTGGCLEPQPYEPAQILALS